MPVSWSHDVNEQTIATHVTTSKSVRKLNCIAGLPAGSHCMCPAVRPRPKEILATLRKGIFFGSVLENVPATHAPIRRSIQENVVGKEITERINDILGHLLIHLISGKARIVGIEVAVRYFGDADGRLLPVVINRQIAYLRKPRWQPDYGIGRRGEQERLVWECLSYGRD